MQAPSLIVCLDVDYRDAGAVAAGVWFRAWPAATAELETAATIAHVEPYVPGEFYKRELPCLMEVLSRGSAAQIVIVDGYVWLGAGRPGLGAHLFDALGGRASVVGVAKTSFAGATDAVPVYRGGSKSPLFVTAGGAITPEQAAAHVASMHGPHRVPTLLRRVDRLARTHGISA
jgi:deoxyribonuclease V